MRKTSGTIGVIASLAVLGGCATIPHSDRGQHFANPEFYARKVEIGDSLYSYMEFNGGRHKQLTQLNADEARIVYHDFTPSIDDSQLFSIDTMEVFRPRTPTAVFNRDSNNRDVRRTLEQAQTHVESILDELYYNNTRPFDSPPEPFVGPPSPD